MKFNRSSTESQKLVDAVKGKFGMTDAEAETSLSIICQKGGTSKKAQGNIYSIVNGKKLELHEVRTIIKNNNLNFTLRQWARTYATNIYKVCNLFGIEGDLAKKIARNRPEVTNDEKVWLSNFQMDNTDCPQNIRDMLMEHYKAMFPNKTL
jgi:hypothetical protein